MKLFCKLLEPIHFHLLSDHHHNHALFFMGQTPFPQNCAIVKLSTTLHLEWNHARTHINKTWRKVFAFCSSLYLQYCAIVSTVLVEIKHLQRKALNLRSFLRKMRDFQGWQKTGSRLSPFGTLIVLQLQELHSGIWTWEVVEKLHIMNTIFSSYDIADRRTQASLPDTGSVTAKQS